MTGTSTLNLPPAIGTFQSRSNWFASITPRVGLIASDPIFHRSSLAYIRGGVAFAEFSHSFVLNGALGPFVFPTQSSAPIGWTVGTGVEVSLGNPWTARMDVSYYDFGSDRYTFSHPTFGPARMDISNRAVVSKVGVTYWFQ